MPEHFSKATVEANVWCPVCRKPTMHFVHDGRRGGCKTCIKRREDEAAVRPAPPEKQGFLF